MKDTIKKCIADELRGLRAKKDITIVELAENIGINKDTICKYENGMVPMNIDVLEKMLDFYNIDFDIFFTNACANKHNILMQKEKEE